MVKLPGKTSTDKIRVKFRTTGENKMKKRTAVIVSLILICTLLVSALGAGCSVIDKLTGNGHRIQLGSSSLSIDPVDEYVKGEMTAEDTTESQVAYYYSDTTLVDFDVYQWARATGETLSGAAAEEAALYNAQVEELTINGKSVARYFAVEESDGVEYETATYMIEDGDFFVELVFWLDGDDAQAKVDEIMDTLK